MCERRDRVVIDGQTTGPTPFPHVLDVGRTSRLATPKQRTAVLARQGGSCATPGCHHTHLEVHHVTWWSVGGPTDLANLVGLCTRCHHLVHQDRLTVTPDGHGGVAFTRTHGLALVDDHRRQQTAIRRRLRALRTAVHNDQAASPSGSSTGTVGDPYRRPDTRRAPGTRTRPSPLSATTRHMVTAHLDRRELSPPGRGRRQCWDIQHPGTSILERHITIDVEPHRRT